MSERVYLMPLWLRLWHWTNAALIITLAVTGASLHWADPTLPLVEFALAARIHDVAGLALLAAYGFFVVANVVSGNWWQYVPKPPGVLQRCLTQVRWYCWGIFRGEPHPYPVTLQTNFNALQALIYWGVMYLLMPLLLATGVVFMLPQLAPDRIAGFDGLLPVALLHTLLGAAMVMFMVSHIYLGTTGRTVGAMFRTMVTGWHQHD